MNISKYTLNKIAFLLICISTQNTLAWNVEQNDLATWLNQLAPTTSVYQEMQKFFVKQGSASTEVQQYMVSFTQQTHSALAERTALTYQNSLNPDLWLQSQLLVF